MPCGILKSLFAIVVIASANAFSFSGASAGTIAYYRFEGPNNQQIPTIFDLSGNNNNGTVAGEILLYNKNVPFAQVPQTGQADTTSALFASLSAPVFGYEFPFNTLTNATLELWVLPNNSPKRILSGERATRAIQTGSISISQLPVYA